MEIKKRVLNIKYDGQSFEVTYPSFGQLCDYQEKIGGLDTNKEVKKVYKTTGEFLIGLGLPSDVYEVLEASAIENILGYFNSKKK